MQVALQRVAAADLDPRDRRVPLVRSASVPAIVAERQMIEPRGRVQAGPQLVAAFDRRRHGAQAARRSSAAPRALQSLSDGLGTDEIVVARVLDVGAPGRCAKSPAEVDAGGLRRVARVRTSRARRRRRGRARAAGAADTRPASCLPSLSSTTSGLAERAGRDRDGRHRPRRLPRAACTPVSQPKRVHERQPRSAVGLPSEKLESHPRPRMRSSSSAFAGSASGRSDVRY